ncbi:unnamed protein product [Nesidiocoris tenuis]|uniref:Uncharacterized protein n=1 Tax=Nesidiocoris tenuis TaxID=355587 RepID=A0A6H5G4Z8_9HEMI|nr:unnamed protein product [Nesidiocoris tenuis]
MFRYFPLFLIANVRVCQQQMHASQVPGALPVGPHPAAGLGLGFPGGPPPPAPHPLLKQELHPPPPEHKPDERIVSAGPTPCQSGKVPFPFAIAMFTYRKINKTPPDRNVVTGQLHSKRQNVQAAEQQQLHSIQFFTINVLRYTTLQLEQTLQNHNSSFCTCHCPTQSALALHILVRLLQMDKPGTPVSKSSTPTGSSSGGGGGSNLGGGKPPALPHYPRVDPFSPYLRPAPMVNNHACE